METQANNFPLNKQQPIVVPRFEQYDNKIGLEKEKESYNILKIDKKRRGCNY